MSCFMGVIQLTRVIDDPLYGRWNSIKQRCYNRDNPKYPHYGGKGVTFHDEWKNFYQFKQWALSNGYKKELTIDRIDSNGNYEPSNCRWVSQKVQQNNRTNNRLINLNGKEYTLSELSEKTGINRATISQRLDKGMSIEETLETKINYDSYSIEIDGVVNNLKSWCSIKNISYKSVHARIIRGWDIKKALNTPIRKGNYSKSVKT